MTSPLLAKTVLLVVIATAQPTSDASARLVHARSANQMSAGQHNGSAAPAGERGSHQPEAPESPSPAEVLRAALLAYASAPYAERLEIEVTDIEGRVMRSSIRLRVDPRRLDADARSNRPDLDIDTDGAGPVRPSQVWIELGALRLWAGPGELIAIHGRDSSGWWGVKEDDSSAAGLLRRRVPPMTLPSLAILSGDLPLSPLAPEIEWIGVTPTESQDGWVLAGRAGDVAIQAMFDRATHRLARLVVAGASVGSAQRVSITARPEPIDKPASWKPAIDGRQARDSLSEILRVPATVHVGDPLPRLACVREDGRAWSIRDVLTPPGASNGIEASPGVALLLMRATVDGTPADLSDVRAALSAIRAIDRDRVREAAISGSTQQVARLKGVPCVVFELESFSAQDFDRIARDLTDLAGDDPGIVWTSPARQSIDAVAPNAASVAVIVDAGGVIRAVMVLDGLGAEPSTLDARLRHEIDQLLAR